MITTTIVHLSSIELEGRSHASAARNSAATQEHQPRNVLAATRTHSSS
ncbi:hypothetical protein WN944_010525 [Citrus x changshan-huyou]|uniref:Uncharacterized protein n=1 Tax=Citrus x changshan-huyou TaxID=2935761 RepID=A0AAP0MWJ6_9ROSI